MADLSNAQTVAQDLDGGGLGGGLLHDIAAASNSQRDPDPAKAYGQAQADRRRIQNDNLQDTIRSFETDRQTRAKVDREHPYPQPNFTPWTEKPPENDPDKSFLSFASLLGIAFGMRTRQPLTNALNASAAAMNASRAGDLQRYQQSYQIWKENMTLLREQATWELKARQEAMAEAEHDFDKANAMHKTIDAWSGLEIHDMEDRQHFLTAQQGLVNNFDQQIDKQDKIHRERGMRMSATVDAVRKMGLAPKKPDGTDPTDQEALDFYNKLDPISRGRVDTEVNRAMLLATQKPTLGTERLALEQQIGKKVDEHMTQWQKDHPGYDKNSVMYQSEQQRVRHNEMVDAGVPLGFGDSSNQRLYAGVTEENVKRRAEEITGENPKQMAMSRTERNAQLGLAVDEYIQNNHLFYDPAAYDLNQRIRKYYTVGSPESRTLVRFGTATSHLEVYDDLIDDLNNKNGPKAQNAAVSRIREEFNDPRVIDVKAATHVVAAEMASVAVGAGVVAQSERDAFEKSLESTAYSNGTAHSVLGVFRKMMGGKIGAMEQQFTSHKLPESEFMSLLTPAAKRSYEQYKQEESDRQTRHGGTTTADIPKPQTQGQGPVPGTSLSDEAKRSTLDKASAAAIQVRNDPKKVRAIAERLKSAGFTDQEISRAVPGYPFGGR